ncbi:MAG: type IV pilus secretin PilQ [Deferribacterota bacterium]|nr:type IV pilus secretin PilQ [Deferribacterota bacterium]
MITYKKNIIIFIMLFMIFSCAKYDTLKRPDKHISYFSIAKVKDSEYMVTIKGSEGVDYNISYAKNPYKLRINMPMVDVDPSVLEYSYSDEKIEGVAVYPSKSQVDIEILLKSGADYTYKKEDSTLTITLDFAESVGVLPGVGSYYETIKPYKFDTAKAFYDLSMRSDNSSFLLDLVVKGIVRYDYGYLEGNKFYIDLYDINNYVGARTYNYKGFVKSIRVGDYDNPKKTRVLLTIEEKIPLYLGQDGTSLKISNDFSKVPKEVAYIMDFNNIHVKRYQSLLFTLSRPIDFKKKVLEGKLIIEFNGRVVPIKGINTLRYFDDDVPFKGYKILTKDGKTTIIVEPADTVYATVKKTPDGLVVSGSFEPFAKAEGLLEETGVEEKEKSPEERELELITLNIKDMDVREAIRLIYFGRGKNLIFGKDVEGEATLFVENIPYRTALNIILNQNNLVVREEGNLVWIMTEESYKRFVESITKEKEEKMMEVVSEPPITKEIRVNFYTASELQPIIETQLSERGRLQVLEKRNSYIVTDIPYAVEQIERLIESIDKPTKQVMIEARIVEVTDTGSLNLGIQWGGKFAKPGITNNDFPSSIIVTGQPLQGGGGGAQESLSGNGYITNFPFMPSEGGVGTLAMTLGSVSNRYNLDMALQALERQGKVRIISAPRVTTLDNVEAEINSGQTAVIVPSGDNTQAEEVDTGIRLTVTPHITANNMVFMEIEVEKSSLGEVTANTVTTAEKTATTQVLLSDGETTVIGGLLENETNVTKEGWPILHRIPIIGPLFGGRVQSSRKEELMVFLRPRIVTKEYEQVDKLIKTGGLE